METVSFTRMENGTTEDYALLDRLERKHVAELPDRIMDHLRALEHSLEGYKVSRLEHSLQAATRAEEDGADKELVAAALIHDLGDDLSPYNHAQLAASIIRPYVREEVTWAVEMHGLFQMQFYGDKIGEPTDMHESHKDNPYYETCMRFCRDWDQAAFDPDYPSKPLEHFEPLLREIFTRPAFDPAILKERAAA
ncbi:HD domain-containing protein [Pararhizobium mangrovi]|uniref:HD domain-containing protein n=1 Tax=Pararhizobium mangrovi TaxID=2590452 RepID=A0A506U5G0_9HYPH|nr:HD domain-containing protein [Pararhizobium mangrovi]TPW28688.1 HD domain-containing protein [Pararhizobium mangrovi]